MVVFLTFLAAGMLLLFSAFFLAVLEDFGIHPLHLAPNSIVLLAIFAHLCEMFVGVMSSVALFGHYFVLRTLGWNKVAGSCSFCLRDGLTEAPWNKWDNWHNFWVYIELDPHAQLVLSTEPAMAGGSGWERVAEDDDQLLMITTRMLDL